MLKRRLTNYLLKDINKRLDALESDIFRLKNEHVKIRKDYRREFSLHDLPQRIEALERITQWDKEPVCIHIQRDYDWYKAEYRVFGKERSISSHRNYGFDQALEAAVENAVEDLNKAYEYYNSLPFGLGQRKAHWE